jgi:protein-S-isoprenylcysteine O-methyltransferase Ste14
MTEVVTTSATIGRAVRRFLSSTPKRTFLIYPLCVVLFEFAVYGQWTVVPWTAPLLAWGYLQYRLTGNFRHGISKGSSGMDLMPERLVERGPYRYTRNPMYLGHLIFMAGLALTFKSWLGLVILATNMVWFHRRVLEDEARLTHQFGAEYTGYTLRVRRWIPYLF